MLESSPTSLLQEWQQIDLKNPNPEVPYCKSFVLSILHPRLFFRCMTCMTSQLLLQLWCFFTCKHSPRDIWICASWEAPLLPLGGTERRGKQFSFFITGCSRVLLGCPFLCDNGCEGSFFHHLPQDPPKSHRASGGDFGLCCSPPAFLLSCASLRLLEPGRQPAKAVSLGWKLQGWGKSSGDFMQKFEAAYFTMVNSSHNRDQALIVALCERLYCVRLCIYIYPLTEWDPAYPQESTTYTDKGRRKEILFPIFQMGHWISCPYCDCVNEVIARTSSAVGLVTALFVVRVFRDWQWWAQKSGHSC